MSPAQAQVQAVEGTLFHAGLARRGGNRRMTVAAAVVAAAVLVAIAVLGCFLEPAATSSDLAAARQAPSAEHLFGTDQLGRDMLLRTVCGLSTSVRIGLLAAVVSSLIALVLGSAAALGGKRVDAAVRWLIDLMMGVPHIVLLILISFALGRGALGVTVGVALTHWPSLTRVVRAEMMQVAGSRYVSVARQLGASRLQVAVRHMLPAVFPQFVVGLILLFPHAILHESAITFLGFGLPAEMPAIGVILSESMRYLSTGAWWLAFFPGLSLVAIVMLFDACGQCVRRLVDPHQAQG